MKLHELDTLLTSKTAKDIFGDDFEAVHRRLARICHPDMNLGNEEEAKRIFQLLELRRKELFAPKISIQSERRVYELDAIWKTGDYSDVYVTRDHKLVKVARNRSFNEVLAHEYDVVCKLQQASGGDVYGKLLPLPVETFLVKSDTLCRAVVFEHGSDLYSFEDVYQKYPKGVDPADMAWMLKRLLQVLGFIHSYGYIHGAVLPSHVLINPVTHGIKLIGWTHSVKLPGALKTISSKYESTYPKEVFDKKPCSPSLDVYMAGKCIEKLLGNHKPHGMIRGFLQTLTSPTRPDDAWGLYDDFDAILRSVYGPPKFRTFSMGV